MRALFCTNNISELTERQRLVDIYLHTTPLVFWYLGLHRISKHTEQMTSECQAATETIECAVCFVRRPPSGAHLTSNYNYFPANQGPRPLFYKVLKLFTHDRSSLCLALPPDLKFVSVYLVMASSWPWHNSALILGFGRKGSEEGCSESWSLLKPPEDYK